MTCKLCDEDHGAKLKLPPNGIYRPLKDGADAAWAPSARRIDLPFFREQSYHTLSRQDAALWADLGTYRA